MDRREFEKVTYALQLKKWYYEQRKKTVLDDLVQSTGQKHVVVPTAGIEAIRERIRWIYHNLEYIRSPNMIVDPCAITGSIELENSVIFIPYINQNVHLQGRHNIAITANLEEDTLLNRRLLGRLALRRNGAAVSGDYEVNNVYYTFGGIEPFSPPAIIFAECAELLFDSRSYAKATDGMGGIRKYRNGTFTLNGAVILLEEISRIDGKSAERSETSLSRQAGGPRVREMNIGFYGHLAKNPLTTSYQ